MFFFKKKNNLIYNKLTWKIGGEAGNGIATSGSIFSKICARGGLFLHSYQEYPSLIRGGHNTFQLTIREEEINAPFRTVDFLIALNKETIDKHIYELGQNALILYDTEDAKIEEEYKKKKDMILCGVPLAKLSKDSGADRVMRNTVAIGASIAILDYDFTILENLFKEIFSTKGEDIVSLNIKSAEAGFKYIKDNFDSTTYSYRLKVNKKKEEDKLNSLMVIAGNESMALGSIRAGVKFYAGYPMTPSSTLMQYMAANQTKYNIVVKHTEDEISAANMAIGASFAGVRAMTGSSGGGFSLMVESLGLAAITETPLVVVNAQRPGPATGLPTWTEQADLRFVIHASQDEFPRIVIAPGDSEECFYTAIQAHNLAEKYQMLVIILTDRYLAESAKTTRPFDFMNTTIERGVILSPLDLEKIETYKRFDLTPENGVSPRTLPGTAKGIFLANSDEHDEHGFTSEEAEMRVNMQNKRMKKLVYASVELPEPVLYGPKKADITFFGWGSTKGVILETMKLLDEEGISANFLQLLYINPFPSEQVYTTLTDCKYPVLIENNMTGQLGGLITQNTGYEIEDEILKYDGRPFFPEELLQKVKSLKNKKGLKKWAT